MKKIVFVLLVLMFPHLVFAYSSNATSTIVMDTDNNKIVYASNIHKVRSVASISKIMTAILAIESGKLDDEVIVGSEIKSTYGSAIYISEGEELTLKDLVYGLMLRSGNDASYVIAKYVGGTIDNFIKLMNNKAIEIGMKNTVFNNPNGLDDNGGNLSTAYDMALLSSYAIKNDTYKKIVGTKKYNLKTNKNVYSWTNKNKLLKMYEYAVGGKTGYTDIAKRTLVTNASKGNVNLTIVTLNDGDDFNDHIKLYEEAFKEYENYEILKEGYLELVDEKYYPNRKFYIKESFNYILNDLEKNNIVLKFYLDKKLTYSNGEKIGYVYVYIGDKEVFKTNLYIELKKKKVRIIDIILGWFK